MYLLDMPNLKDFFKARILGIFLSGFISAPLVVYNYLNTKNLLTPLFNHVFENLKHFKTIYDRKLIIMGLSSFWQTQFMNEAIDALNLQVFTIIIYMMIVQQYDEQKKHFKTRIITKSEENDHKIYKQVKAMIWTDAEW